MQLAAQLGACQFILPYPVGSEVHFDLHTRNEILLEAKLRHPEVVNDVFRSQSQFDRTVNWNRQRRSHRIVSRCRITRVETDKIQRTIVNQRWISLAKFLVRTSVVEVPLKLLRDNFDCVRSWRRIMKTQRSPHTLSHHSQRDEDDRGNHRP